MKLQAGLDLNFIDAGRSLVTIRLKHRNEFAVTIHQLTNKKEWGCSFWFLDDDLRLHSKTRKLLAVKILYVCETLAKLKGRDGI